MGVPGLKAHLLGFIPGVKRHPRDRERYRFDSQAGGYLTIRHETGGPGERDET